MSTRPESTGPRKPGKPAPPAAPWVAPSDVARAGVHGVRDTSALVHELSNILDGSLRLLSLALRAMDKARGEQAGHDLEKAHHQVSTASFALERMADLVHAAMHGASVPVGSTILGPGKSITLGEAIEHAARVIAPEAEENHITIVTTVDPQAAAQPAGTLYSVVLNGLRNSIDSILAAQRRPNARRAGSIEVTVRHEDAPPGHRVRWTTLSIRDDGEGPPAGSEAARVFDHGFSTRAAGRGVGLALAHSLTRDMHGTIALTRGTTQDPARPGAVLRVSVPALAENQHSS